MRNQSVKCLLFFSTSTLWTRVTGTTSSGRAVLFYRLKHTCAVYSPSSKVHGANMGPIWGRQDPGEPHVGPMNFAIWVINCTCRRTSTIKFQKWFQCLSNYEVNYATSWCAPFYWIYFFMDKPSFIWVICLFHRGNMIHKASSQWDNGPVNYKGNMHLCRTNARYIFI